MSLENAMGRKKNTVGHHLKHYCYTLNLADEAEIEPCGYQLQKALGQLPKQIGKEGTRNNKYDRYFYYGDKTSGPITLQEIQAKYPKSSYILDLPFWELFDNNNSPISFYEDQLIKMPADIKKHLFSAYSPDKLKKIITHRNINSIERIGTPHALASILALYRLNESKESVLRVEGGVIGALEHLLEMCCIQAPLDKILGELIEAVGRFLNEKIDHPDDYIILASRETFIYYVTIFKSVVVGLRRWHITEGKSDEIELMYWLLQCNDVVVIDDYDKICKKLPINHTDKGILWLLEKMSMRTRGIIHTRIMTIHEQLKSIKV
jgi:hypothetical protein